MLLLRRCRIGVLPCRILAPGSELPLGRSWPEEPAGACRSADGEELAGGAGQRLAICSWGGVGRRSRPKVGDLQLGRSLPEELAGGGGRRLVICSWALATPLRRLQHQGLELAGGWRPGASHSPSVEAEPRSGGGAAPPARWNSNFCFAGAKRFPLQDGSSCNISD